MVADWLASRSYVDHQNDTFERVQDGSGQWFLTDQRYEGWLSQRRSNLVLRGLPGGGKTFLASIILNDLRDRFDQDVDVLVLHFYNSYTRKREQTALLIMASLLRQAFRHDTNRASSVRLLYDEHQTKDRESRPKLVDIMRCFREVLEGYNRAFVVIDALDECHCSESDHLMQRNLFLTNLATLQLDESTNLSVLVTM